MIRLFLSACAAALFAWIAYSMHWELLNSGIIAGTVAGLIGFFLMYLVMPKKGPRHDWEDQVNGK